MIKRISLFILLACCFSTAAFAQKSYDEINFPELNEFEKPEVVKFQLDNGIRFFLIEDHELPIIDVNVKIRTGGIQVPDSLTGLAGVTGFVVRTGGTESIPSDSLEVLLANNAAQINTSIGLTSGSAGLNVLKEDFDKLLPIFIDVLMNPAFPKEKIALIKKRIKSSIARRNDNVNSVAGREFRQIIYGNNSIYGRVTQYATVNNIDRKEVTAFHEENFVGKNMMVGVVGDFDTEEMKEKLKKAFGQIPAGQENNFNFPEIDYQYKSTINFINKPAVTQATVYLGHIGGNRPNPDYAEVQVMNNVLSGGLSSRLFSIIRTEMGLAYAVGGRYVFNKFYPGVFIAYVKTKHSTVTEAIDAIIKQLERLQNEPISKEELKVTKDKMLNSIVFRDTGYEQILGRIMRNEYRRMPEDTFDDYIEGVRNTTIPEVQKMAQKYLHPDDLQILVVGNKKKVLDQLKKYGDVNIIDISIPKPGDDQKQKVIKGDADKGAKLLSNMADAIIAPGTTVKTLNLKGELQVRGRKLATAVTINYPDEITQTVNTPRGKVTFILEDGKAVMKVNGKKRPLPASSPQTAGLKSSLNRSIVAIALKADKLKPKFIETTEFNGETYNKIKAKVSGTTLTILLDQKTNLPEVIRYEKFSSRMGKTIKVEKRLNNWTTKDGVTYPYKKVIYISGKKGATQIYSSHKVN